MKPRRLGLADRLSAMHTEHDLVRPEVSGEVHGDRQDCERADPLTAEKCTESDEDGREHSQEEDGSNLVLHRW
jgi:hypothetical protein